MEKIEIAVNKYRELILKAERQIWSTPETGYKEIKTSTYLANEFVKLGYDLVYADGITGFYTIVDTGRPGPEVLILGELDSVVCPSHKDADPVTGAVHACGHNTQSATLLGIAATLKEDGVLDGLCGRIRLCAVPAEEFLEIEYRKELKKQGKIKYFGGKTEFLHRGMFDGVDIALMVHAAGEYFCNAGSVGFIAKNIIYKGVASHAGASPWYGRNALYAATCGLNAVNAIRETFYDPDLVRFHPIITHGGDIVNAIPETAQIESYIRAKTFDAMVINNKKINRALIGAALSLGNNIDIIDIPGYSPLVNDKNMIEVASDAAKLVGIDLKLIDTYSSGSTDMGDLSAIMPVVQPYAGGTTGMLHGKDFCISDPESACVTNAKWQLAMVKLLLENGAERAKNIMNEFKPTFSSKEEFLAFLDNINQSGNRIDYKENNTAEIKL